MWSRLAGVPGKLTSLITTVGGLVTDIGTALTNLTSVLGKLPTSGRAVSDAVLDGTKIGYLNASISSRAAESPALLPPMASGLLGPSSGSFWSTGLNHNTAGVPGYPIAGVTAAQTTAYQTLVSVTGSGVLQLVSFGANNSIPTLRITIDGVVVMEPVGVSINTDHAAVGGYMYDSSVGKIISIWLDAVPFKSQLLIEGKAAVASGNVTVRYKYRRTS